MDAVPDAFFPHRMVHLDFHTGPDVPDVGARFDPELFARTFEEAGVDSVTVFAKCHHGQLYYDTLRPERHPGLSRDIHLLEDQVGALHARGIRAPIYLSVQCDEYAANVHPEWIALDADLRQVKWGGSAFQPGWQILDMSSPYQEYLVEQIAEVIEHFAPLDGMFLDMTWDQPSASTWAKHAMLDRGLDPAAATDRDRYARDLAHEYMGRFRDLVEPHLAPGIASGVWFNSRPKTALADESQFIRHIEVESLPTGGWGYAYFPYVSRFVHQFGLPTLSHTGRFYKSWGDNGGLKPHAALLYECAQILAQGMTPGIGDLLHPSGAINQVSYELIGSVYRHIRDCEPFLSGTKLVTDIALVVDPALGDTPGAAGFGAVRALQQLRQQFAIVGPDADLDAYALVIIPETTGIDDALAGRLNTRADAGRATMVVRGAAHGWNGADRLTETGVRLVDDSPFSTVFLRRGDALGGPTGFDHVVYDPTLRVQPIDAAAEVLAGLVEPYFDRTWAHFSGHEYTPPSLGDPVWPALVQSGSTIVSAIPLFELIGNHGAPVYRELLGAAIDRLLPQPAIRMDAPVHVEATVTGTGRSTVVHLLSFLSTRVADSQTVGHQAQRGLDLIEDPIPLVDAPVSIRTGTRPTAATLQPGGESLDVDWDGEYAHVVVTMLGGHAMIVLET